MSVNYVITELKKLRKELIKELRGNQNKIEQKLEIEKAIKALETLQSNNIQEIDLIDKVPFLDGHGWYECPLMIDNESGNPKDWVPHIKEDGNYYTITPGDLIIRRKEI